MKEGVQQKRGLVGALLLTQRRVQTVEVDLEGVRLLRGRRRRVYVRSGQTLSGSLPPRVTSSPSCIQRTNKYGTLRVSETSDGLAVGVGPVGPVCQVGEDQQ